MSNVILRIIMNRLKNNDFVELIKDDNMIDEIITFKCGFKYFGIWCRSKDRFIIYTAHPDCRLLDSEDWFEIADFCTDCDVLKFLDVIGVKDKQELQNNAE